MISVALVTFPLSAAGILLFVLWFEHGEFGPIVVGWLFIFMFALVPILPIVLMYGLTRP